MNLSAFDIQLLIAVNHTSIGTFGHFLNEFLVALGFSIAVDSSGNAYVTGYTVSPNFPTKNPYQGSFGGGDRDAFVTKLSSNGNMLNYSTYLGGSRRDEGRCIAVDSLGNAYLTGVTYSFDFPTKNPYQDSNAGIEDAFVTKLRPGATGEYLFNPFKKASDKAWQGSSTFKGGLNRKNNQPWNL
ncbi:MAG: SBBP repeat-containing protein [Deltaproteobacteria bacterium]|nr:SBBP repeat-containing protein [Deltaproteobacteria bacterium]